MFLFYVFLFCVLLKYEGSYKTTFLYIYFVRSILPKMKNFENNKKKAQIVLKKNAKEDFEKDSDTFSPLQSKLCNETEEIYSTGMNQNDNLESSSTISAFSSRESSQVKNAYSSEDESYNEETVRSDNRLYPSSETA